MSSRLGGGSRKPINELAAATRLHIHRLETMTEALMLSRRQVWKGHSERDGQRKANVGNRPVDGDKPRLAQAVNDSDRMIEDAIASDPRLARKAQWVRRDEGEHCDSGLIAEGDDQPFYKRIRNVVNDEAKAGEPFRVVISTDDDEITKGTAAAFIATIRIVQQFVPVEVWWQGAWLSQNMNVGFISHVPLVRGDMDFSRLEFCIADPVRDTFSYDAMSAHCVNDLRESWHGCGHRADQSYLPEAHGWKNFISHQGIRPHGPGIAEIAARWIGLEPMWEVQSDGEDRKAAALQKLPPLGTPYVPYKDDRTEAQKRRDEADSERRYKERKRAAEKEAAERISK